MQIQINTDRNIEGHQALAAHVSGVLESALSQMSDHITRVEVHLSDENSEKGGPNDNRCALEARGGDSPGGDSGPGHPWRGREVDPIDHE